MLLKDLDQATAFFILGKRIVWVAESNRICVSLRKQVCKKLELIQIQNWKSTSFEITNTRGGFIKFCSPDRLQEKVCGMEIDMTNSDREEVLGRIRHE